MDKKPILNPKFRIFTILLADENVLLQTTAIQQTIFALTGQKIKQTLSLKVAHFQKVRCVCKISKSPQKIFQITILNLKYKFSARNSRQLIQILISG